MDSRAQVSVEYLLMITIAVVLVIAASLLALQLGQIAEIAKARMLDIRDATISSLMG